MQIYVHHNGQQLGPFTEAEVRAKLADGSFASQDLVWWQGQANWMALGMSFLGLPALPAAIHASTVVPLPPPPPVPSPSALPTSRLPHGVRTSTMAIGALVLGILGFGCGFTGVGAVILGHLSLSEIKRYPDLRGREMALVGLVLGYIVLGLYVLRLLRVVTFVPLEMFFHSLHVHRF